MDILFKKNDISGDMALIVGVYENQVLTKTAKKVDADSKGALLKSLKNNNFSGKIGEKAELLLSEKTAWQ